MRRFTDFWTEELARRCGALEIRGGADAAIKALEFDSRKAGENTLFFALPGLHTDGSLFIDDAIKRGASAVVYEGGNPNYKEGVLYIKVKDAHFAMSPISAAFYDEPSKKLKTIGVTGTEGKSTTVYLIFQLLRAVGFKCGFISTVQYSLDGKEHDNSEHQTTPEAPVIQARLAEMLENNCEYAVIEASSHGLSPRTNRLGDVFFNAGVMTNVRHEHLEFHKTFENYRDDKARLFRAFSDFGVLNLDDWSADYFINAAHPKPVFTFSIKNPSAALFATSIEAAAEGNEYSVHDSLRGETFCVRDSLPGAFNALNVLAALLVVSRFLDVKPSELAPFIPKLKPVRGRMTRVCLGQDFEVIVDYAHTPSSFETIFPPLRSRLKSGARIISVFGSAGERDTQKRPLQGEIAAKWSDIIVLTDEDPRGERSEDILAEIAEGVLKDSSGRWVEDENLFLIPERAAAIRKAFSLAKKDDIVLLLGKGHENSIIYGAHGKSTIVYDEIEEAKTALHGRRPPEGVTAAFARHGSVIQPLTLHRRRF